MVDSTSFQEQNPLIRWLIEHCVYILQNSPFLSHESATVKVINNKFSDISIQGHHGHLRVSDIQTLDLLVRTQALLRLYTLHAATFHSVSISIMAFSRCVNQPLLTQGSFIHSYICLLSK